MWKIHKYLRDWQYDIEILDEEHIKIIEETPPLILRSIWMNYGTRWHSHWFITQLGIINLYKQKHEDYSWCYFIKWKTEHYFYNRDYIDESTILMLDSYTKVDKATYDAFVKDAEYERVIEQFMQWIQVNSSAHKIIICDYLVNYFAVNNTKVPLLTWERDFYAIATYIVSLWTSKYKDSIRTLVTQGEQALFSNF